MVDIDLSGDDHDLSDDVHGVSGHAHDFADDNHDRTPPGTLGRHRDGGASILNVEVRLGSFSTGNCWKILGFRILKSMYRIILTLSPSL